MNISVLNDTTGQPNYSGIQTLVTPTSQYVFPPSVVSTNLQPVSTTNTTSFQDVQIQKYPPFIGQSISSLQSTPPSGVHHMVNANCKLTMISSVSTPVASTPYLISCTSDSARKVPVHKPSSIGKTSKAKPSKSTSAASSKGSFIAKTTKKIKLDSSYITPQPSGKSTPRKKVSSVGSNCNVTRTLSTPSSLTKAVRKTPRMKFGAAVTNMGRWHPTDDLALINAIQQTNDLVAVYKGVKFSCKFTQKEIEERWHALLLDRHLSKLAMTAVKALNSNVEATVLKQSLWSDAEEQILAAIPSTEKPVDMERFENLLSTQGSVFHHTRTAHSLYRHWELMKHFSLLNDQDVPPISPSDDIEEFSDVDDQINDNDLSKPRDSKEEALEQELMLADRLAKRQIVQVEQDIAERQHLLGIPPIVDFGNAYAIWRGKHVQFEMKSNRVTIGRGSSSSEVDFNLLLEGTSYRISRKQATMEITEDGNFILTNCGRRPIYVDGRPVLTDRSMILSDNQLVEICSLSFLVLLNHSLVAKLYGQQCNVN